MQIIRNTQTSMTEVVVNEYIFLLQPSKKDVGWYSVILNVICAEERII